MILILLFNFSNQINLCLDASQSSFSQIQKLKGDINENAFVDADNVPTHTQFDKKDNKKNRAISLHLTDGTSNIKGFEYQNIPALNDSILPGSKVNVLLSYAFAFAFILKLNKFLLFYFKINFKDNITRKNTIQKPSSVLRFYNSVISFCNLEKIKNKF